MPFTPLTSTSDIATAFGALSSNWRAGAQHARRDIAWRPATQTFDVWWRPQDDAWAVLEPHPQQPHYYIFIGLDFSHDPLNIDCQFDLCTTGYTRRLGGVFLRDDDGDVYIGHTGLIGGGVPGVGRNSFIAYSSGRTVSIAWPDGIVTDGFAVGEIHSSSLGGALHDFAELKRQFKASVKT